MKWEAVTSVSGLSSDSEVSFVIAGFEDPSGNPMSSSNTAYVDRTSDSSRIRMDVTDPHVTAKLIASDSSLNRDIDRPGYQLALADETITLRFETSERVETPSSLTINGQSGITVSSQSGDTTGMKWEAVTSVSGLSSDSEVSFVIAGFEDPSGNPMSSTNTAYVDRTSDRSRIWMDVTDPHVILRSLLPQTVHSTATSIAQAISWHWQMRRSPFVLKRASG